MQSNNTITSLNELIGICDNILYKTQQMKQELSMNNQDKNLIQFFSDLCFSIQKISNSLQYFRTSNNNLSLNFSNIMDKNSELEEKIKNLQNQNIYLETSLVNLNHKIQDLNSTLIEKEIIIQDLSNTKNNLCLCNCNCPCCKEKNNNVNNSNTRNNIRHLSPLNVMSYNSKNSHYNNNNIYSNNNNIINNNN